MQRLCIYCGSSAGSDPVCSAPATPRWADPKAL